MTVSAFTKAVLIDDDTINNMVFEKLSRAANLTDQLITIISPLDALNYFENLSNEDFPDIIFIDIKMPIMNGWEFYDQLKKDKRIKDAKIFFISSSINHDDIERAHRDDLIIELISKPINIRKFIKIKQAYI